MAPNKRILYLGGGREAEETLEKARDLGLEIIYIQRKKQFRDSLLPYVDEVVLTDFQKLEVLLPLAQTLQALFPFAGAISMSEPALVPTAHICEALGLPGNSVETVTLLKDKGQMRARLNSLGISPVAADVGHSLADLHAFAHKVGCPMIVKPVDASGSLGVFRVDAIAELEQVWQQVQALQLPRFLMEEYLDGPEMSVESFSFHGRHVILALTDKLTLPNHVEIGHSIPAQLDQALEEQVKDFVVAFLDAVKFAEGPAHTEVKLTKHGPRIIESHNRPGGDRINELVRVAYGFDMKEMAFRWLCGLVEPLMESPRLQAGAAIRFFTPPPGLVQDISGLDAVQRAEGLVEIQLGVKVGGQVRPIHESYDRAGHVVACGPNVQEAIRRCERMVEQVRIVTSA